MKKMMCLALLIIAPSVWGLDSEQCPENFSLQLSQVSIYKNSQNSEIPGWKEAKKVLSETPIEGTSDFQLSDRRANACLYTSNTEIRATLMTVRLPDAEISGEYHFSESLFVQMKRSGFEFNFFLDVGHYDVDSLLVLPRLPEGRTRLRVRLPNRENSQLVNYELGLVRARSTLGLQSLIAAVVPSDSGIEIWINTFEHWKFKRSLADHYSKEEQSFVDQVTEKAQLCNLMESIYEPCREGRGLEQVKRDLIKAGVRIDPEFQSWAEKEIKSSN